MAKWLRFSSNFDYRWPSRAVTAFRKGQKVYVKDEVAAKAIETGAASEIERPEDNDPDRVATQSTMESRRRRFLEVEPTDARDIAGARRSDVGTANTLVIVAEAGDGEDQADGTTADEPAVTVSTRSRARTTTVDEGDAE